jgi:cyclophilin family peptidyl-prolyl cis-trans isomerase
MTRTIIVSTALALATVIPGVAQSATLPDGLYAEIATPRGTIVCLLEYTKTPMTVANFVGLAEGSITANGANKKYFDGLTFHRVEDWVIQGGDPSGNGTGGPGYQFPNEIDRSLTHAKEGVLAMANAGPDTNGSQFYITLKPAPSLDGGYSIFGHVVQGMDVVKAIKVGDKMSSVRILRVGASAGGFVVTQKSFDALVAKSGTAKEEKKKQDRLSALASIKKQWPNLTTTSTGLMYEVLKKGSGDGSPGATATVSVNYTAMLLDGKVIDSTAARGQPASLRVDRVIKGWTEALKAMKRGEKRRLLIPPELGYGSQGYANVIPPNSFLLFEVELIDF